VYSRGEVQAAVNAAPSSAHSKLEPVSLAENSKLALVLVVVGGGPKLMVVCGAVVSTVHVKVAGVGSAFPARSTARTSKVCAPWLSPETIRGLEQET
jgi:hypothetical protein